jgi:hypothetical protein
VWRIGNGEDDPIRLLLVLRCAALIELWIGLEFGKRKTPVVKIASEACMGL